ncbi:MAG: NAD kinase [Bacteroidia bacterium]
MRIAIYGRNISDEIVPLVELLLDEIEKAGGTYIIFESYHSLFRQKSKRKFKNNIFGSTDEIRRQVDFLLSIGGDGTMLDTVTIVQNTGIPVLGVNTGRLGFLSSVSIDEIAHAIDCLSKGHYALDKRALLKLETNRQIFGDINYALNELTIHKKDSSSMINIHTYLNGEYLTTYWADGLIIATPTGSTGYSLSCGGPIVAPASGNFVITPIAPHNLNVRPIVVSDKNIVSLEVEGRSQYFLASLDSRSVTIDSTIQFAVRREDFTFNIVRIDNQNFLQTLRNKLMWGMDRRN